MKQWNLRGVIDAAPPTPTVVVDRSADPLALVLDQVPALFWTTDDALRITTCLGASLADLGLGPNQLVGATLSELFGTDPNQETIGAHRRALRGRPTAFELSWGRARFDGRVAPLRDARGAVIGTVCAALLEAGPPLGVAIGPSKGASTAASVA